MLLLSGVRFPFLDPHANILGKGSEKLLLHNCVFHLLYSVTVFQPSPSKVGEHRRYFSRGLPCFVLERMEFLALGFIVDVVEP